MEKLSIVDQLSLMEEKKKLLEDMLRMTEDQAKFIIEEEVEKLEDVLYKKELIIDKINEIDLKAKGFILEEVEDEDLSNTLLQIKDILNKIKVLDDNNTQALAKAMTDMNNGLKEVREGKRAMENYSNTDPYHVFATQGGTLFIDQDS